MEVGLLTLNARRGKIHPSPFTVQYLQTFVSVIFWMVSSPGHFSACTTYSSVSQTVFRIHKACRTHASKYMHMVVSACLNSKGQISNAAICRTEGKRHRTRKATLVIEP